MSSQDALHSRDAELGKIADQSGRNHMTLLGKSAIFAAYDADQINFRDTRNYWWKDR